MRRGTIMLHTTPPAAALEVTAIGTDTDTGAPVAWPADQHGIVSGRTGAGKTAALATIASAAYAQAAPVTVHVVSPPNARELPDYLAAAGVPTDPIPSSADLLANAADRVARGWRTPSAAEPRLLILMDAAPVIVERMSTTARATWEAIAVLGPLVGVTVVAAAVADHHLMDVGGTELRNALADRGVWLHLEGRGSGRLSPLRGRRQCVELRTHTRYA
jgi:hypothetical protein